MIRILATLVLFAAMALPHCLCWMTTSDAMACHAAQKKAPCCCGEQPEVRQADADVPPVLPAPEVQLRAPGVFAEIQSLFSTLFDDSSTQREIAQDLSVSRASPSLYLIHTSFLI